MEQNLSSCIFKKIDFESVSLKVVLVLDEFSNSKALCKWKNFILHFQRIFS